MAKKKPPSDEVRRYLSDLGKRGGPARRNKLTPERRSEIARIAARARWAKRKREQ